MAHAEKTMTETQISEAIEALWLRWLRSGEHDGARGWQRTRNTLQPVTRARVRVLAWHIACEHDDAEDDEAED
jgi:hypothetical protein